MLNSLAYTQNERGQGAFRLFTHTKFYRYILPINPESFEECTGTNKRLIASNAEKRVALHVQCCESQPQASVPIRLAHTAVSPSSHGNTHLTQPHRPKTAAFINLRLTVFPRPTRSKENSRCILHRRSLPRLRRADAWNRKHRHRLSKRRRRRGFLSTSTSGIRKVRSTGRTVARLRTLRCLL